MTSHADGGSLEILNVGAGHLTIEFNKANPAEVARAKRMVEDMLQRGYAIFIHAGGKGGRLLPVRRFDPKTAAYIVEDVPGVEEMAREHPVRPPKNGRRTRRIPMATAKATVVGRTAGG